MSRRSIGFGVCHRRLGGWSRASLLRRRCVVSTSSVSSEGLPSKASSPALRPTIRCTNICASATSWMLMMAADRVRRRISQIRRMIWREVLGSSEAVGSSTSSSSRILDQRAGDADALALPAGQRVGALVGHVQQADAVEQAKGASSTSACGVFAGNCARSRHSRAGPTARSPSPSGARPARIPGRSCPSCDAWRRSALAQPRAVTSVPA
jgi:hypothetical protein